MSSAQPEATNEELIDCLREQRAAVGAAQRLPVDRALLTLLTPPADETALLAEAALADDWLKPEEDEAWAHLHEPMKG